MSTSPRISIVFLQGAASTGQSDANPRVFRSSDVRRPAASMQSATYLRVLSTQNWPHRKGSGAVSFGRGQFVSRSGVALVDDGDADSEYHEHKCCEVEQASPRAPMEIDARTRREEVVGVGEREER